jgi:hypothetical protein
MLSTILTGDFEGDDGQLGWRALCGSHSSYANQHQSILIE